MQFRTEYKSRREKLCVDPAKPVVLAGSCFSQNISVKMDECGWETLNPFGTLYNPFSIGYAIDVMIDERAGIERFQNTLFQYDGVWHSCMFDTSFSGRDKNDTIEEFTRKSALLIDTLERGKTLIVTFGTSICYHLVENDIIVGNCHKQPSKLFYTQRMSIKEILHSWALVNEKLKARFPGINVIFTVSPVRHLKDGMTENSRSKAVLLLAEELICETHANCVYFPAYEILIDDLRDYRFYAADLVHPSDSAIEYIWEKFRESYLDEKGELLLREGLKRRRAENHRPMLGALGKQLAGN